MLYNNSTHQMMVDIINFASIVLKYYLSYNSIVSGQSLKYIRELFMNIGNKIKELRVKNKVQKAYS